MSVPTQHRHPQDVSVPRLWAENWTRDHVPGLSVSISAAFREDIAVTFLFLGIPKQGGCLMTVYGGLVRFAGTGRNRLTWFIKALPGRLAGTYL